MNFSTLNTVSLDDGKVIIKRGGSGGGATINNQSKVVDITENGTTEVVPDSGFTGLSKVEVNVNVSGGSGGGESNITYYRYDIDNALAIWGDNSTEFTFILYANIVGGLDITGISPNGKLMSFAEALYSVCQDSLEGSNTRIPFSYYATKPNTIKGKHNPQIAEEVTNMHDFIRLACKEILQWSEEQTNAAVALFTEISEEEFYASITA